MFAGALYRRRFKTPSFITEYLNPDRFSNSQLPTWTLLFEQQLLLVCRVKVHGFSTCCTKCFNDAFSTAWALPHYMPVLNEKYHIHISIKYLLTVSYPVCLNIISARADRFHRTTLRAGVGRNDVFHRNQWGTFQSFRTESILVMYVFKCDPSEL